MEVIDMYKNLHPRARSKMHCNDVDIPIPSFEIKQQYNNNTIFRLFLLFYFEGFININIYIN